MQIKSEITQHLDDESGFHFVKMYLLHHFSDHICQRHNFLDVRSKLPGKAMINGEQAYQQSNSHKTTFLILRKKARMEVFQY
jgi:hypothetical protein